MLADKLPWQRVELRLPFAIDSVVLAKELPDVEEYDDEEVKRLETGLLHWEPSVAICGVPALDLDPHLGRFAVVRLVRGFG